MSALLFGRVLPAVLLGFLFLPMLVVIPVALTDRDYLSLPEHGLSLAHFAAILSPDAGWLSSIGTSLAIAILAAVCATSAGTAYAMGVWTMTGWWPALTRVLLLAPLIVPPIVYAVGIFRLWARLDLLDTGLGVTLVHIVLCLPFTILAVGSALSNLNPTLVQAARSLGARPPTVFFRVILPNIRLGVAAGAVFAFITSWDEITVTLFITARGVVTLPRRIWTGVTDAVDPALAAIASLMLLVTALALLIRLIWVHPARPPRSLTRLQPRPRGRPMAHTPAMSEHEYRENMFFKVFGSVPVPGFEDPAEQTEVWGRPWGCSSDIGRLRAVLMHRPGEELAVVENKPMPEIGGFGDPEKGWYWMGRTMPDLPAMQAAHDTLAAKLRGEGVDVIYVDKAAPGRMKQIFTRDSVIGVKGGAIVTRLARKVRRGEELPVTQALAKTGCPILATLHGEAVFEGGGFAMIDDKTAVCSVSVACNAEGVRQIEAVLDTLGVELIKVPMPGYRIHIDGSFMMVDVETAIINVNELPYVFIEVLKKRGMKLIELPPDDNAFSVNCLAVKPGRILVHDTMGARLGDLLDKHGITVIPLDYGCVELGGGGIHCSTAPLARDPL